MNILVLLPVNDRHRAILESSAPGEDFIYTSADAVTREQVADADVILGNIDPAMLTACEHLQLLQLQSAGMTTTLPLVLCRPTPSSPARWAPTVRL